ncbi:MAG: hypothetical protein JNK72_24935 [Myxococcales bacterium]|nr:hypothetical protein [Myxococcales bacterium]
MVSKGVRFPQAFIDECDALKALYPTADGSEGSRSSVIRAFVAAGQGTLLGRENIVAVRALAKARGIPLEAMWAEVFALGLAAAKAETPTHAREETPASIVPIDTP